ncbi:MAG TPA: tetratricopeptide repeat protein [Gemmatimonadales bacterium]|nr:tetratricopeptide repeat protein [Gemmatimonadales bacterium]
MSSLADESALLLELDGLAAAGRYQALLDRLGQLPAAAVAGRTRIALLAAEAQGRLGRYAEAERWAATARDLARSRGERHAELRALNFQAAIALNRGDLEEAERHFSTALEMAGMLRDAAGEARCFNNLGIIAFLRGDPNVALAAYQPALAAYQRAGMLRGMAQTHHNIGISRRELGDYRGALEAADQAVRLARQVQDDSLVGLALAGRAEIHLAMGDAALADAELRGAEQAYERVQFSAGLPEVWRLQAGAARARGDLAGAVRRLERAAELAAKQGSAEVLSATERDLGHALAATGDHTGARAAWQRAIAIYRRLGARKAVDALAALLGPT